jgi:integrase
MSSDQERWSKRELERQFNAALFARAVLSPLKACRGGKMTQTFQHGYLRRTKRKTSPDRWEFLWREIDETGKRLRRTAIIGTLDQYPSEESALAAANGVRMEVNRSVYRRCLKPVTVADLIDHYIHTDLSVEAGWHSVATRTIYRYFLEKWIRPQWGKNVLSSVRTLAVEHWLRTLKNAEGDPLADATKAKIRSIFSVLFNHAIRCEWLEQGKNPILMVRQSAKRKRTPTVFDVAEIQLLLPQLDRQYRLMVMLAVTTGFRRSELFGLKWCDVNFSGLEISICRSIYLGIVGDCKTETSCAPVPITARMAAELWIWKETTQYSESDDWVFASRTNEGRLPLWPGVVLQKVIRPAAVRAGVSKRFGWHTFRHTYSTLLIANGENVKVVQELMRHASSHFTLQIYSQAQIRTKRAAQSRLVEAILSEEISDSLPTPVANDEAGRHPLF